jgi:cytochrome b561
MCARDSGTVWGWVTRVLHWSMAAVILFQLGFGLYMVQAVPDLLQRFTLTQIHKSWGFVVFVLAVIRVGWRLANRGRPALPAGMPAWQIRAAGLSHLLLYLMMFVMPVSGWIMASASPTQDLLQMQNMVFGTFALPDLFVPGVQHVEDVARSIHVAAALLLAAILAIHAGAALKHQFVDRDDVLAAMVFGNRRTRPRMSGGAGLKAGAMSNRAESSGD